MSQTEYRLVDFADGLSYPILAVTDYWVGESGARYVDCLIERDGKPSYWCANYADLIAVAA